jgi:L-alanine-DL-glutamate epimerase-like enolase superfamily enzyme
MTLSPSVRIEIETWPVAGAFTISRGARREATVVVVHVSDGAFTGRGECVPYARYGKTVESVRMAIHATAALMKFDRAELQRLAPPGAARNALDCALWDLEAKRTGKSAAALAGLAPLAPLVTAYTISLGTADAMAQAATAARDKPLLKIKLGGQGDAERMRAVRAARPDARLIADANEGWTRELLSTLMAVAAECGFEVIEQPLPAGEDAALAQIERRIPVCADESVHTRDDLAALAGRYDAINIKLDKTGGLTEALSLLAEARGHGFKVMVGCMVATSLAMAPAILVAQSADWVDLDGPLLLARDRVPGLRYDGALVHPAVPQLWG